MAKKEAKTEAEKQQEKERRAKRQAEHKEQERKSFITKHSGFNIREKDKKDATLYELILKDIIEYRVQLKHEAAVKAYEAWKQKKPDTMVTRPVMTKSRNPTVATVREAAQLFDIVKLNPDFRPFYLPSLKGVQI